MRILLAAKHAPYGKRPIGGVQSWCRTVAHELSDRGHDVTVWGPEETIPLGGFDLGIIANTGDTSPAFQWCQKYIVVCHGIIPAEKPGSGDLTAFTSEEVRAHWNGKGPIIRQPIDVEFWSPSEWPLRIHLTRFSYRRGLPFVETLAKSMKYKYQHLWNHAPITIRSILRDSVCVLATGRAALEAMACDVPVVICDHRSSYQGPLMDLDINNAMSRNYSGRGGIVPTVENVKQAIEAAMASPTMRGRVLEHHTASNIVDQLLAMG